MPVKFIGANPCLTLFHDDARTGLLSAWEAEWSVQGSGRAVLVWTMGDDSVRLLTPEPRLGTWLADSFSRYLPEFEGLPAISDPTGCDIAEWHIEPDGVRFDVAGSDGSRVVASMGRPEQTRPFHVPQWQLGEVTWTLTNLLTFCAEATLEIDGAALPGEPRLSTDGDRLHSTAFIATHETWIRY